MLVKIGKYPKSYKKNRKVEVEIHDSDTYSLDLTLALIIVPALKKLKELKHGAPFVDNEDVPEELHSSGDVWNTDENWFKRWDYVLDQMIWAFSEVTRDWEKEYYSGKPSFKTIPVDKVGNEVDINDAEFFELKTIPNDTFKIDTKGIADHENRIKNGLRLFSKYYLALWT